MQPVNGHSGQCIEMCMPHEFDKSHIAALCVTIHWWVRLNRAQSGLCVRWIYSATRKFHSRIALYIYCIHEPNWFRCVRIGATHLSAAHELSHLNGAVATPLIAANVSFSGLPDLAVMPRYHHFKQKYVPVGWSLIAWWCLKSKQHRSQINTIPGICAVLCVQFHVFMVHTIMEMKEPKTPPMWMEFGSATICVQQVIGTNYYKIQVGYFTEDIMVCIIYSVGFRTTLS